jgi:cyclopropane fatty-acyl-phospholipid synthase-like methyltransferase
MSNEWFKNWFDSPYYHLLYQNRDHEEAEAFVKKLITQLNLAPNSKILDVACGKGRHAKQMAELGFRVVGIDLSENSIAAAKEMEGADLAFHVHDMRIPFELEQYQLVVNCFTSFGYFETEADNQKAMDMMSGALESGGLLVLDYLNAGRFTGGLSNRETKEIEGVVFEIQREIKNNKIVKTIGIVDEKQNFHETFEERVSLLTLTDFEKLMTNAGLEISAIFGNHQLDSFIEGSSERLIILAKKL